MLQIYSQTTGDTSTDIPEKEKSYIGKIQESMGENRPQSADEEEEPRPNLGINYFSYFRMIITLAIVIVVIFVLFQIIKKRLHIQNDQGTESVVITNQSIGPGKWIQIVFIAGKYFILGVTNENINLIKEIEEPAEIERLDILYNTKMAASGGSFMDMIGDFFARKNTKANTTAKTFDYETDSVSFLKEQSKRLKDIENQNGND